MPKVGKVSYSYTKKGVAAAKKASDKSGMPMKVETKKMEKMESIHKKK